MVNKIGLDIFRLINHFSSSIVFLLLPVLYFTITFFTDKHYGIDLIICTGISLPVAIFFYIVKRNELYVHFYKCRNNVSIADLKKALQKVTESRKWKLSEHIDPKDSIIYFEIKTPATFITWGFLLTVIPSEKGFLLRCINTVDFLLNQVYSFGHRKKTKSMFISDLREYLDCSLESKYSD